MKIRNVVLGLIVVAISQGAFAQEKSINTDASSIEWLGKKIGGEHNGFINLKSGSLEFKDSNIVSGSFSIDMNSIINEDIDNEEYNAKLVGHLKSDDFFGVATYPTSQLKIIKASKFKNGMAKVTGDLTIKGKTETITFDVKQKGDNYMASIDIDRSKFDVRYGSKSFFDNLGDKVIDDIFTLTVKLVLD